MQTAKSERSLRTTRIRQNTPATVRRPPTTTAYNDCVFIACPRSNTVETMEGDDIVYFREEVHNNKVALGPGRDKLCGINQ